MTKILVSIAALTLVGAASLPLQANAAEQKPGISKEVSQSTDISARRRHYRRYYARYYVGPRRYWGPRYGYGYPYPYGAYSYGYYRPAPFVPFGFGPFGVRVF